MKIFKRIEVWILLVLTAAGLVYVLLSRDLAGGDRGFASSATRATKNTAKAENPSGSGKGDGDTAPEPKKDTPLEIKNVSVKREGEQFLTEIEFVFDNQTDQPIHAIEDAKIVTEGGSSIPVFFLAFTGAPPVLSAMQKSETSLHFALPAESIVGALDLEVAGHSAAVKSSRSFDPASIADNESRNFKQLDW